MIAYTTISPVDVPAALKEIFIGHSKDALEAFTRVLKMYYKASGSGSSSGKSNKRARKH